VKVVFWTFTFFCEITHTTQIFIQKVPTLSESSIMSADNNTSSGECPFIKEFFPAEHELKCEKRCTSCKKDVSNEVFRDNYSKNEFAISGFCQQCQDNFFGMDDEYPLLVK